MNEIFFDISKLFFKFDNLSKTLIKRTFESSSNFYILYYFYCNFEFAKKMSSIKVFEELLKKKENFENLF